MNSKVDGCKTSYRNCKKLEDSSAYLHPVCHTSTGNLKATLTKLLFAQKMLTNTKTVMNSFTSNSTSNSTNSTRVKRDTSSSSSSSSSSTVVTTTIAMSVMTTYTSTVSTACKFNL